MCQKSYFLCDLKNDESLIAEYKNYHQNVWPKIIQDIQNQGIANMEIFNFQNRLVMVVTPGQKFYDKFGIKAEFSWEKSAELADRDEDTLKVLDEWEDLMDTFQKRLENSDGIKWVKMEKIFSME